MEDGIDIQELHDYLRRFALNKALAYLGVLGKLIWNKDSQITPFYPRTINEWQLGYIAKALILNSNDHRAKDICFNDILRAASLYNESSDALLDIPDDATPEERRKGTYSFLIRTAFQQFPSQIGPRHLLPRTVLLFDEIPNALGNSEFDINQEIRKIFGLTIREIIVIGFCILINSNGYLSPNFSTDVEGLKQLMTKEKIDKLINIFLADYNQIRTLANEERPPKGMEKYSFSPLLRYPLIKTQYNQIVVPMPQYIFDRITNGIYYDLVESSRKSNSNKFLEFFGKHIFEEYIGLMLGQQYKKDSRLFKEWEYGSKQQRRKTSDWIVIEKDTAIFFECKTSGITKEAKCYADLVKIQEDLQLRVIKAIEQMIDLEKACKLNLPGLEKLSHIKKFRYIAVTYDRIFLAESSAIREIINKELEAKGHKNVSYNVLSIGEVENLVPVLKKYSLSKLLDAKSKNDKWDDTDFDLFVKNFLKASGDNNIYENVFLKNKFNEIFKTVDLNLGLKIEEDDKIDIPNAAVK